jgi:hypothetical protein
VTVLAFQITHWADFEVMCKIDLGDHLHVKRIELVHDSNHQVKLAKQKLSNIEKTPPFVKHSMTQHENRALW